MSSLLFDSNDKEPLPNANPFQLWNIEVLGTWRWVLSRGTGQHDSTRDHNRWQPLFVKMECNSFQTRPETVYAHLPVTTWSTWSTTWSIANIAPNLLGKISLSYKTTALAFEVVNPTPGYFHACIRKSSIIVIVYFPSSRGQWPQAQAKGSDMTTVQTRNKFENRNPDSLSKIGHCCCVPFKLTPKDGSDNSIWVSTAECRRSVYLSLTGPCLRFSVIRG